MTFQRTLIALTLGSLLLAGCSSSDDAAQAPATTPDTATTPSAPQLPKDSDIVAEVNGENITAGEINAIAVRQEGAPDSPELRRQILNEVISHKLVYQDAVAQGLDKLPEITNDMQLARANLLIAASTRHIIALNPITEEEIGAAYTEYAATPRPTEYKARHILVAERDKALEVIKKLADGGDFEALAREYSTGPSGPNGGDLGWFSAKQMVAPFTAALETLEPGSTTQEPVQTQYGWHVIKLEERRPGVVPPLEQVRDALVKHLEQQRVKGFVDKLRADATITFP